MATCPSYEVRCCSLTEILNVTHTTQRVQLHQSGQLGNLDLVTVGWHIVWLICLIESLVLFCIYIGIHKVDGGV